MRPRPMSSALRCLALPSLTPLSLGSGLPREPLLVSLSASVSFGSRTYSSQEGWFYTWILSVKQTKKTIFLRLLVICEVEIFMIERLGWFCSIGVGMEAWSCVLVNARRRGGDKSSSEKGFEVTEIMGQSIDIKLEEKGWISRVRKVGNIRSLFTCP